jgi:hypothetical protein
MIVPQSKKQDILHYFHDIPSAGHLGVDKILEKLKTGFYWPNMKDYVQKYCRSCDRCFAQKPKKETNKAPLGTYISGEPTVFLYIIFHIGPVKSCFKLFQNFVNS